jgi:hypothetical protein
MAAPLAAAPQLEHVVLDAGALISGVSLASAAKVSGGVDPRVVRGVTGSHRCVVPPCVCVRTFGRLRKWWRKSVIR